MGLAEQREDFLTYADYLHSSENERYEIIDGKPYDMSLAPSTNHQRICRDLSLLMYQCLKDSSCELFIAPFDVRLPLAKEEDIDIINVVQPDISVICDPSKLDEKGCKGAPDLIVEITSPGTALKDRREKYFLYQNACVQEYWLVYPFEQIITIFTLQNNNNQYASGRVYGFCETVHSAVIPDLQVRLYP